MDHECFQGLFGPPGNASAEKFPTGKMTIWDQSLSPSGLSIISYDTRRTSYKAWEHKHSRRRLCVVM